MSQQGPWGGGRGTLGGPCAEGGALDSVIPQTYLLLSSVHCWPWSSSLDRQRQRPWAGSPEAVSSTCVVSGLLTGSMPLPWARREGQDKPCVHTSLKEAAVRVNSLGAEIPKCPWGGDLGGCGGDTLKCSPSTPLTCPTSVPTGPSPPPTIACAPCSPSSVSPASRSEPRPYLPGAQVSLERAQPWGGPRAHVQ